MSMRVRVQIKLRLISMVIAVAMGMSLASAGVAADGAKPASAVTKKANDALRSMLPFNDKTDFVNAKRGLIAKLPKKGVVKDADGNEVAGWTSHWRKPCGDR